MSEDLGVFHIGWNQEIVLKARFEPDWQPIDTAPKDKSLLGAYKGYVYEMQWSEDLEDWIDPAGWRCHPTHWMPLPKPPGVKDE